jgi:hypothetical protein
LLERRLLGPHDRVRVEGVGVMRPHLNQKTSAFNDGGYK